MDNDKTIALTVTTYCEIDEGFNTRTIHAPRGPEGRCGLPTLLLPLNGREYPCEIWPSGRISTFQNLRRAYGIGCVVGEGIHLA